MQLAAAVLVLNVLCMLLCGCTAACAPEVPDAAVELIQSAGRNDVPITGAVYHRVHAPSRELEIQGEVSPYVYAAFDKAPVFYAGTLDMRDQCTASVPEFPVLGTVDVGARLEIEVTPDVLEARRARDYFKEGSVVYLYDPQARDITEGRTTGGRFSVRGEPAPVVFPPQLQAHDLQVMTERLTDTGILSMTWDAADPPDVGSPPVVIASVKVYKEDVASSSDLVTVTCIFRDDGRATADLSTLIPDGWMHYFLTAGRMAHGFIDHDEFGETLVVSRRDFVLEWRR